VKTYSYAVLLICFGLMAGRTAFAQQPPPQQLPASVSGKWILYCKDPNGATSAKYLDLEQKGSVISGTSKGRISPAAWKALLMSNTSWFEPRPATC
jgi:hypothetical protein